MCGTGWLVEAAKEGQHESSSVLVAESAVQNEIAGRVQSNQTVENVSKSPENGIFVWSQFCYVEYLVDQGGGRGQLANDEHDNDGDECARDFQFACSCLLFPLRDILLSSHSSVEMLTLAE